MGLAQLSAAFVKSVTFCVKEIASTARVTAESGALEREANDEPAA